MSKSNVIFLKSGNLFYILPVIMTLLLCLTGGCSCSRTDNRKEASEIKNAAIEAVNGDTTEYAREFRAHADSLADLGPSHINGGIYILAKSMMYSGHHKNAIRLLESNYNVLRSWNKKEDTPALLNICICLGAAYEETGMPGIGLDYYSRGLELSEDSTYNNYKAMLYNNIGVLYSRSQCNEKAIEYFKKALEINLKESKRDEIALNYNNLSEMYNRNGNYRDAIDSSLKGLQYNDKEKNPELAYYSHLLLGLLYSRTGEYDLSLSYIRNGLSKFIELNSVPGIIEAYHILGESFQAMGLADSTVFYTQKAIDLARNSNLHPELHVALMTLGNAYRMKGNYAQAAKCFEESELLADSIHKEESKLRLQEWSSRPENNDINTQLESLPQIIIILSLILLLFTALLTYLIIKYRKSRNERNSLLANMDVCEVRSDELQKEVDRLNRERTSEAMEKMKIREGLDSICDDIREIIVDGTIKTAAQRSRHREILEKLSHLSSSVPDDFKQYFEKVHPDFYNTLIKRCPALTQRDMRLCGFLVLGLSTKEIASLTFREVRSVESARNRLKKKLGLETGIDLSEYLRSLTHQNNGSSTTVETA